MTEDEAKQMCMNAIEAGIYHDLGSGSNVDILIIKKGKHTLYRNIKSDNKHNDKINTCKQATTTTCNQNNNNSTMTITLTH